MSGNLLFIANWKANMTLGDAKIWLNDWGKYTDSLRSVHDRVQAAVAPPATLLHFFGGPHWDLALAAQDVSRFTPGAYTGEIPAEMLSDLGVHYCLLGHSERRKNCGETTESVAEKLVRLKATGVTPVICARSTEDIPGNLSDWPDHSLFLMYEPEYAISQNGVYHPEDPDKVRETLSTWRKQYKFRLLYGGSVNSEIVKNLVSVAGEHLSGFVVGHASLSAEEFFKIIQACL